MEKLIFIQLDSFFTKHSVIVDSQYGFCKGRSTELALLRQKEVILTDFENKRLTLGVYVDFKKAFDSLNHSVLLKKLYSYGVRGTPLALIESYLGSRRQLVEINGHLSSVLEITSGVPQGSILGPLLFNIYINDIVNICPRAHFVIYADDASLFFSGIDADEITRTAKMTLKALDEWSRNNCLQINTTKTKGVLFRPKNKRVIANVPLTISGDEIELVNDIKTLGVFFSYDLSWDIHVDKLSSRLSQVSGTLWKCKAILSTQVKLRLYNALFFSLLCYGHLIWGTTTKANLNKLTLIQKRAARAICNEHFLAHTKPIFLKLGIISVTNLYEYRVLVMSKFGRAAIHELHTLSHLTKNDTVARTRAREVWLTPRCRTTYGTQMIRYQLPTLLNKYCYLFEHSDTKKVSKKAFRAHYLNILQSH